MPLLASRILQAVCSTPVALPVPSRARLLAPSPAQPLSAATCAASYGGTCAASCVGTCPPLSCAIACRPTEVTPCFNTCTQTLAAVSRRRIARLGLEAVRERPALAPMLAAGLRLRAPMVSCARNKRPSLVNSKQRRCRRWFPSGGCMARSAAVYWRLWAKRWRCLHRRRLLVPCPVPLISSWHVHCHCSNVHA